MKEEGYITFFDRKKKFGFIDCPSVQLNDIFFFHLEADYKQIHSGDEVLLYIRKSTEYLYSHEAYEIEFVCNKRLEVLLNEYESNNQFIGFLKKIEDSYFVKDKKTHLYIKLNISRFELDINSEYDDKLNKEVPFEIIVFSDKNKLRAVRTDRVFKDSIQLLINQEIINGTVVKKDKFGIYVNLSVLDVVGFVPNNLIEKKWRKNELNIGDAIDVYCFKLDLERDNILLDLA